MISRHIDVNMKDKEGTTPICFSFRASASDMIDMMLRNERVNLDIVSPKYGCPLHFSILKHKFELALRMMDECKANPHILNPNGSNAMHILFANF